ncbi:MAG: hypothetical protein AB1717_06160 [Pseudomonadota bacterium]
MKNDQQNSQKQAQYSSILKLDLDWSAYSLRYKPINDPIEHYINNWRSCPVKFDGFFDQNFYLTRYPSLAHGNINPLVHYTNHGIREGRSGFPDIKYKSDVNFDEVNFERIRNLLTHCESLGDNCEFGQVMRYFGHERGGLFRWAGSKTQSIIRFLNNRPSDIFQLENLTPATHNMVMDSSILIGFHSMMKSIKTESGLKFIHPREERENIHINEKQKMDYLADRFFGRLKTGRSLFVIKSQRNLIDLHLGKLIKSLSKHKGFPTSYLLVVRVTEDRLLIGTIDGPHPDRTINAWVSRFAPLAHADQVKYDEWTSILSKIANLNLFTPIKNQP